MAPRGKYVVRIFCLLLVQLTKQSLPQNFRKTDDRVERRTQLMGNVGEKLRLVPIRRFQLSALRLDFTKKPGVLDRQYRLRSKSPQEIYNFRRKIARPAAIDR